MAPLEKLVRCLRKDGRGDVERSAETARNQCYGGRTVDKESKECKESTWE